MSKKSSSLENYSSLDINGMIDIGEYTIVDRVNCSQSGRSLPYEYIENRFAGSDDQLNIVLLFASVLFEYEELQ